MRIRSSAIPEMNSMIDGWDMTLTIAPHVHVCVTAEGSVLLDLKRDKYLGLGREDTELLAAAISAWPRPRWDYPESRSSSAAAVSKADALCRTLAADELLLKGKGDCGYRVAPSVDYMKRDWISIGDEIEVDADVTPKHIANFMTAFTLARCSLAWRQFWFTVETARLNKTERNTNAHVALEEVAALVGVFRRLRPFAFAAEGRCLLHALTLIKFLSRYGFYPDWVIGVAMRPWAAHSWVQWGDCLLDTNPEKVCRFTPILVV
jgi:hypothetical protein